MKKIIAVWFVLFAGTGILLAGYVGELKKGTAYTLKIGPFTATSDGVTLYTTDIVYTSVYTTINGSAPAAKHESSRIHYHANNAGLYDCNVDTTDTATAGKYTIDVNVPGTLPVNMWYDIVDTNHADARISGTKLPTNVAAWSGTNIPGVDTAGYPKVTVKSGTGTGELSLASGVVGGNVKQINGTTVPEDPNHAGRQITALGGAAGHDIPYTVEHQFSNLMQGGDVLTALGIPNGTVATGNTASSFTVSSGFLAVTSAYPPGTEVRIMDLSDSKFRLAKIRTYTSGRVMTLQQALDFTPAVGDIVVVGHLGYARP